MTRGCAGDASCIICPPATLLYLAAKAGLGTRIGIGAQDCHIEASGAFTGEISAEMLADCGATTVIVGHSERRSYFAETDGDVKSKAFAALRAGLMPIICVGETNSDREAGRTLAVIKRQLAGSVPGSAGTDAIVVAYEPIWAIGTGLTPTLADIAEVHRFIHRELGVILQSMRAASAASSTEARSNRPMHETSLASTMSMARWSEARASMPRISSPLPTVLSPRIDRLPGLCSHDPKGLRLSRIRTHAEPGA